MRKYNIASDLIQVKALQPVVYKQYDNGDELEVELLQDGEKIELTTETVLAFFELPDGTIIQKNCTISNGNAITVLDNNILSQSGTVKAEFSIVQDEAVTTTRTIMLNVEGSIDRNEAVETVPKWDIVNEILELKNADPQTLEEKITILANSVEEKYNELSAAKQIDSEVILARNDSVNGKNHSSLKARLDETSAQLAQNEYYTSLNKANANAPLYIKTYDGSHQLTHPKVLAFDTSWNGYKYWMAYTPYPNSNDYYENPCIAASSDGVNWVTPTGLTNPLASLTPEQDAAGGHYSDTHLVYRSDINTLECWYRYNINGVEEKIMRRTTTDGINWTPNEVLMDVQPVALRLSPTVLYEDNKYKLWYVSEQKIWYTESTDAINWSIPIENIFSLEAGYTAWHLDIVHTDLGYEMLLNVNTPKGANDKMLMSGKSNDGITWGEFKPSIYPSVNKNDFDSRQIYRSSFIKQNGIYWVYYSGYSVLGKWAVGLSMGESLDKLVGGTYDPLEDGDGDLLVKKRIIMDTGNMVILGSANFKEELIKFVKSGIGTAYLKLIANNQLAVRNSNDTINADLVLRDLFARYLIIQDEGVRKGSIKPSTITNLFELLGTTDSVIGQLKLNAIQFSGVTSATAPEDGMMRWFDTDKKIKVYLGSPTPSWNSLQINRKGTSGLRPTTNLETGQMYFDTTLNKPIWRNANNDGWVDAMGNVV